MQMLRLLPEQVMRYWEQVKEALNVSLAPIFGNEAKELLAIQQELLVGSLVCWVALEEEKTIGLITTRIQVDQTTQIRNLLIFSLTMVDEHSQYIWLEGYRILKEYARSKNCNKIIAYTDQKHVISLAEKIGADTSWHLLQFPI